MGYGYGNYRNNGIPKLRNYKEALDWWTSIKPIRGREKDTRPLGYRRRVDEYQIRKADDGTIECVLWRDVIVKFKPDGKIHIGNPFTNSTSVANFVNDILPSSRVSAYIFDFDLVIRIVKDNKYIEQRAGDWGIKDFKDADGSVYDITDESVGLDKNYHFLEDKPEVMRKIKRKALREVMERYKPFTEYMRNFHKLHGATYEFAEYNDDSDTKINFMYRTWGGNSAVNAGSTFMRFIADKTDGQYDSYRKALMMLVDASMGSYSMLNGYRAKTVPLESIQKSFEHFIRGVHRDEVFRCTFRTDGLVKRRKHREFFARRWDDLLKILRAEGIV